MQISEIQFFDVAIPEPSAFVLAGLILGFIGLAVRRYR
ncbi:MAG: PEP-CTERM sorting domain-containing protein [Pirellulales bacterium]|nr:PEP-CTERM sorting domain-containing protein [Pirellulales bacterium]